MTGASAARRALMVLAALGGVGGGAWLAWRRLAPGEAGAEAVGLLRGLSLPDAEGQPFDLGQTAGRTLVLNFWATWCPPCVEEMPELAELHTEMSGAQGMVIGIGIDSPVNIREFASKRRFPYPLLVGGTGGTELSRRFGNTSGALPFTVLIDPAGQVVLRVLGRIRLPQLRASVLPLLRKPAGKST